MKIKQYTKTVSDNSKMFLDLEIVKDEPIPDIIRIFTDKKYTHYLYAEFKETSV